MKFLSVIFILTIVTSCADEADNSVKGFEVEEETIKLTNPQKFIELTVKTQAENDSLLPPGTMMEQEYSWRIQKILMPTLHVYNSKEKEIYTAVPKDGWLILDYSSFDPGNYLVEILDTNGLINSYSALVYI